MGVNAESVGGRKMLNDFLRCLGDDEYKVAEAGGVLWQGVTLAYPTWR